MTYRKKMIEVAIPLDAINKEAALRKRKAPAGYPTTLHKWWAQRPLAACRAVLFTSLIDDPGEDDVPKELLAAIDALPTPPDAADGDTETETRRKRLFAFIGELVKWENTTNETVIGKARELILAATGGNPPPVLDPFCGGGSIPLEAQRLGLRAYASDLNPVAVLITKALIEIPPKFAGRPPVNPDDRAKIGAGTTAWKGAAGLAADVRWYGKWMRDRAFERIGHLYPKGPDGETVIAWLWARTVRCPNPACGGQMPLVRSFWLSTKKGKEAWVEPVVDKGAQSVRFEVRTTGPRDDTAVAAGTKSGRADFTCPMCGQVADGKHTKAEGMAGRIESQLMAVVAEGNRSRVYLSPGQVVAPALSADEARRVEDAREGFLAGSTPRRLTGGTCYGYGLTTWGSLFTPRQLVALTTFSDLVGEARALVRQHAVAAGLPADGAGIDAGGTGADAYADAVATYLAFAVDRAADYGSALASWRPKDSAMRSALAKQALPMVWDYAEGNPFATSSAGFAECSDVVARCLPLVPASTTTSVNQLDAAASVDGASNSCVATDPPYYDNIGYADLSDFFYVWLRRSLGRAYPGIFSTLLTPKDQELVATPYRFGGTETAERHFESGLAKAFALMRERVISDLPITVYYAFRQLEGAMSGVAALASTGWEKMLSGLIDGRFSITATWPLRTEGDNRQIGNRANALASSVVLVCRPRAEDAPMATLKEFQAALKAELPGGLRHLIGGHIAPVDLAQAAIGPGMGVFSRYSKVLESNGEPMTVRRALELINQSLDDYFSELEGSLDPDSRFCTAWFEEHGFLEGPYGEAETLSRAKGVGVDGLERDGVLTARAGKVQLLPLAHYVDRVAGYDPAAGARLSAWAACHYLAAALRSGGDDAAAKLARRLGGVADDARDLAYRLYAICERKKWAEEGRAYNELVASWPEIQKRATVLSGETQGQLG